MNTEKLKYVYMLGAGGIGMSALAKYFRNRNIRVAGYDRTESDITRMLEKEGVGMTYADNEESIPQEIRSCQIEDLMVIYTPAIPADSKQKHFFIKKNIPLLKRAQVLGLISKDYLTVAIAGTHGKTTTSAMVTHLFAHSGKSPVAFLGGISSNYHTNYLPGKPDSLMVVEADEYDRSFLQLHPQTAVITSTDPDHLDIYGDREAMVQSFAAFANLVPASGYLVLKAGLSLPAEIYSRAITYHTSLNADVKLINFTQSAGFYQFDVDYMGEVISNLSLGQAGFHNVENSLAALTVAKLHGLNNDQIRSALGSFAGVKRRFEFIIRRDDFVFIDDYAHHPEELKACIRSVKALYPDKKVTGVFQPHLYSRTRDFYQGFAESLSELDTVVLLDIYPARELPIPGVSSQVLLQMIDAPQKLMSSKEDLPKLLCSLSPDVLLTLGAGDIDRLVEPIKLAFSEKLAIP